MIYQSALPPLRLVFLMWLIFYIQLLSGFDFGPLGILPRNVYGLIGIFMAPLIHGNINHLVSNTLPILFLGGVVFFFYPRIAVRVFFQGYFFTNALVWIFGRTHFHIGASGLVYSLAAFLVFNGFFKRDALSVVISLIVMIIYGGLIYGVFPNEPWVSWESHLMGAIVGIGSALFLGKKG